MERGYQKRVCMSDKISLSSVEEEVCFLGGIFPFSKDWISIFNDIIYPPYEGRLFLWDSEK